MKPPVVLITGASSGIGADFARLFAAHGHRVALVARRKERLEALADEIIAAGGAWPVIISCDLEAPDASDVIAAALDEADVEPQYVVNNAGFGSFGEAIAQDRGAHHAMIALNIRALTDISLRFAESLERTRGGILNVASLAGFVPGPFMAVYYASKAYVISFSEALRAELAPRGIRVTLLCPGPVPTEFQLRAGYRMGGKPSAMTVRSEDVAHAGFDGLMAGRHLVIPGAAGKLVPLLVRLLPRAAVLWGMDRVQRRRL